MVAINPQSSNQVSLTGNVGDGALYSRVQSANSVNATSVKATAGRIYSLTLTNHDTVKCFFKLYDVAVAPTVGTTVPIMSLCIPALTAVQFQFPFGLRFATGIGYGICGAVGQADSSTDAALLNQCAGGIVYT